MNIPPVVQEILDAHGYGSLKRTQEQAFESGILEGGNHLLVADTGNGKTLCAEAVTNQTLEDGGRVAYLVPSRQLVRDKRESIQEWCDGDVWSGYGAWNRADVAVGTFDSFYQAILNDVGNARAFDYVVLDDFHEIYGSYRGPSIEKSIAAMLDYDINIFAMSATVGNPKLLADWMDANLIESEEGRQIEIVEEPVEVGGSRTKQEQIANFIESQKDKGPFIVFNASRNKAESRAKAIAGTSAFDDVADVDFKPELQDTVSGRLTPALEDLAEYLNAGVAYHHAGLPNEVKELIEDHFHDRNLMVLCSTTTIAYGFDAPVQSVVVADLKRYDFEKGYMDWVGTWEYVQWIGRAARPGMGFDPGYAYVFTKDLLEAEDRFYGEEVDLEPVTSHVEDDGRFRWFLLELIDLGWTTPKEIERFVHNTLFFEQLKNTRGAWGRTFNNPPQVIVEEKLRETADWLERNNFITESRAQREFSTTDRGHAAVQFNFDVYSSYDLDVVGRFHQWLAAQSPQSLTPNQMAKYVADPFWTDISGNTSQLEDGFQSVLTREPYDTSEGGQTAALLFEYWIRNFNEADITERTGVDATYLGSTARSMATLFDAAEHLFEATPYGTPEWLDVAVQRLEEGVRADQLPLVENVGYLGRHRVRRLHEHLIGLQTQGSLEGDTLLELLVNLREDTDNTQMRDSLKSVSNIGDKTAENIIEYIDNIGDVPPISRLPGEQPLDGNSDTVADLEGGAVSNETDEPNFMKATSLDDF